MEITFQEVSDIQTWNELVWRFDGRFMQSWEQGEVYTADGAGVRRLAFLKDGEEVGCAQIIIVKARRGWFGFVPYGPITDCELRISDWEEILKTLENICTEEKCVSLRVALNFDENAERFYEGLKKLGMKDTALHLLAEKSLMIDLTKPNEELFMELRKGNRYDIRQCGKKGMEFKWMNNEEGFKILMDLLDETTSRQGWTSYSKNFMRRQFEEFVLKGNAGIGVAFYEGKPVAANMIFKWNGEASYFHGASTRIPKLSPGHGLMWWSISECQKEGLKSFNLWGIVGEGDKKHPWWGVSVFKRGFGGKEVDFPHLLEKHLSWRSWKLRLVDRIRKWKRGY